MRTILPMLAALAVVLLACSSEGPDAMAEMLRDAGNTMAEMLHDAASAIDAAGPSDAEAQEPPREPEVIEAACDQTWTLDAAGDVRKYHHFPNVDPHRVRTAWLCGAKVPQVQCPHPGCTGSSLTTKCFTTAVSEATEGGVWIECSVKNFDRVKLVLEPMQP